MFVWCEPGLFFNEGKKSILLLTAMVPGYKLASLVYPY